MWIPYTMILNGIHPNYCYWKSSFNSVTHSANTLIKIVNCHNIVNKQAELRTFSDIKLSIFFKKQNHTLTIPYIQHRIISSN